MKKSIGVIVARFQVHELHAGHRYLIETVRSEHRDVLIVLGTSHVLLSQKDPLDVATRELMIKRSYASVTVASITDHPSNTAWSRKLDHLIARTFPKRNAILYGSRESFIEVYSGKHPVRKIDSITAPCGTEVRRHRAATPSSHPAFRHGIIYAAAHRHPTSFQAVDIAIYRKETDEVLLGRKTTDGKKWRFIGGFVDPTDESLETAARREVYEEAGIETDDFHYVGSSRIDDWRYRGREDSVLSTLFVGSYVFGKAVPGDDIMEVKWFKRDRVERALISTHKPLGVLLRAHFEHSL